MIGFYSYTVILTYLSFASAVLGMTFSCTGHFKLALVCLALSGLFDLFDGKVARAKKNRTEDEKQFGIQIDSLCDVVAFGAAPIVWAYNVGLNSTLGIIILMFYGIAGVIRLAYYNVLEMKPRDPNAGKKVYHGLPITSIAIILPIIFAINAACIHNLPIVMYCTMFIVGLLFIIDFKIPKPSNSFQAVMIAIVALCLLWIFKIFG